MQAAVSALQNQPIVNAVIDGDDIIYRDYIDISVAVGTSKVLSLVFSILKTKLSALFTMHPVVIRMPFCFRVLWCLLSAIQKG